jgi:AcrR family transcriptional regulator
VYLRSWLYTGRCTLDGVTAAEPAESDGDLGHEDDDVPTRILAAAARCFYRDGIWATGVDALAAEAGVSKRTLYNYFGSKDIVIAAYLRQREEHWQAKLAEACAELADEDSEALGVTQHSLDRMQSGIASSLREAGFEDPDALARLMLYLLEGAVVVGGARRSAAALDDAEQMIRDLVTRCPRTG